MPDRGVVVRRRRAARPRSQAHCPATGQLSQRGSRAVQTRAPSSITATAQVAAVAASVGSRSVATSRSARVTEDGGNSTPPTARAKTRRTLVSSTTCRWPNAKLATADAV